MDALGARVRDGGVDVAVYSGVAERVEACAFGPDGTELRVALEPDADRVFRGRLEGAGVGLRYGFRAHGGPPGAACDGAKLLLDPYARGIVGRVLRDPGLDAAGRDSAPFVPRSVVVDEAFDWGDDRPPRHDWSDTVLYEAHVKGMTKLHPGVPVRLRGTYPGLGHDSVLEHLTGLGVTTLELLPVFEWLDEPVLEANGLTDYWGYNPVAWFAPTTRYATVPGDPGAALCEFKALVASMHAAGIEVVLDVVYNHTAEGGDEGDTLSLKGLDAAAYYRMDRDGAQRRFVDTTGCGNSINAAHPASVALVLDSLRYWAVACHVDGFRFDLAPTLGRASGDVDPRAPILAGCASDPVLSGCKLICEPWDLGPDGYALGRFTEPYREWNGQYRDAVRDFWRGATDAAQLATRLAGSRDLFGTRPLTTSVNYVASHDGFTLHDLLSYERKHNEANLESNADGTDDNRSWNCGVEGPTADPVVLGLRAGLGRALLATVLLSRGVPMLLGGDELGRTQGGNNNPYCQDNEVSWLDWATADLDLARATGALVSVRARHAALLADDRVTPSWWGPSGAEMVDEAWQGAATVAMRLESDDDLLYVVVHQGARAASVALGASEPLEVAAATSAASSPRVGARLEPGGALRVGPRSVVALSRPQDSGALAG